MNTNYPCCGITRRGFLLGAATAGIPLGWLALRNMHTPFTGRSVEVPRPALAMPGPFPGRVIEVQHSGAFNAQYAVNGDVVKEMMRSGMSRLIGGGDVDSAWKRFFQRDDIVGIKVNPVGRGGPDRVAGAVGDHVRDLHRIAGGRGGLGSRGCRRQGIGAERV